MDEFILEVNVNEHHFIPAKTIWSYSLETLILGQNWQFLSHVTWKFEIETGF